MVKKSPSPWLVIGIVILTGIVYAIGHFKVSATMTLIMTDLNIGAGLSGWLITSASVMGLFLALPTGAIMLKTGARNLGLFSILSALVGNVLGALAPNVWVLLLSRFVEGIGLGLISVVGPALIALWFPPAKRGLPMSLWSCWFGIGLFLILNLTGFLVEGQEASAWRTIWWLCVILFAVIAVLYTMFVREPDGTRDQSEAPPSLREGLRSAPAWLLAYIFFIFGFGSGALLNFTPAYCQTELGLSLAQANLYTSLLTVGMIGSSIIMGALLNRLKNRRPLLLVAMFLITVIFAFMFSYNAAQALLFMFAGGFIVQMLPSVVFTLAPEAAASPDTAAVAIAIIVLGQTFGGIGPSICGSVIENYGWHAAAVLLTLLSLSGIAATFLYLRTGKRQIAASNNLE